MAPTSLTGSDPFVDPVNVAGVDDYIEGWTLPVGRSASLTLATDSLIVLGMQLLHYAPCLVQGLRSNR